jgi:peptide/nickel transport system substrate-binding protein
LTLNDGVTFWDGTPLTTADVVWSLEHARSSITGFIYRNVDKIRLVDSNVVEITLTKPDSLFPKELASFAGAVMEKKFSEAAGDKLGAPDKGVMCTGPYKFDSWKPGASIELSANTQYWDKENAAHAQNVSLRFFSDSAALGNALKTGEVDGAYEVPAALIPSLTKSDAGKLTLGSPGQQYVGLSPMRTDGPLHSPELRKAFYMTINRTDLAKGPFKGAAKANYTALNAGVWDNASLDPSAIKVWREAYKKFAGERATWGSPDAIKSARKAAEQAGYDGSPIALAIPAGDETFKLIALLIQADAQQAGFKVKIMPLQPIAYADAAANPKARAGIDLYLNLSFNVAPDPGEPVETFLPGTYFNFINYEDSGVSKLIADARASTNPVEAAKDLVDAQAKYEQNFGFQALVEVYEVSFLKSGLGGATASFAYLNQPSLAKIGADNK